MGVMGFSDMLEQLGMAYDSEHAWDFADKVFEFVSYVAIDESANLAAERGSYTHFKAPGWSKGMVPIDTVKRLEADRGSEITVSKSSKYRGLNWDALARESKKRHAQCNAHGHRAEREHRLAAGTTPGSIPALRRSSRGTRSPENIWTSTIIL